MAIRRRKTLAEYQEIYKASTTISFNQYTKDIVKNDCLDFRDKIIYGMLWNGIDIKDIGKFKFSDLQMIEHTDKKRYYLADKEIDKTLYDWIRFSKQEKVVTDYSQTQFPSQSRLIQGEEIVRPTDYQVMRLLEEDKTFNNHMIYQRMATLVDMEIVPYMRVNAIARGGKLYRAIKAVPSRNQRDMVNYMIEKENVTRAVAGNIANTYKYNRSKFDFL